MDNFKEYGFCVKETFTKRELKNFEETFKDILSMQMYKMRLEFSDDISRDVRLINAVNPDALNEVMQMVRNTCEGHRLAASRRLEEIGSELLGNRNKVIISGPSLFINIPSSNSRKYSWHSEQNWYPKRRNFINVWVPIIFDRLHETSMEVCIASHKKDWFYFSEYTGYADKFDKDANVQYEIPDNLIRDYKEIIPDVKLNEALFFDGKLVHRSIDNVSDRVLFTVVFRMYDYSNDLTLSSNWADLPYNRKSLGYPNINVKI